jgi:hypothetical protein
MDDLASLASWIGRKVWITLWEGGERHRGTIQSLHRSPLPGQIDIVARVDRRMLTTVTNTTRGVRWDFAD